MPKFHLLRHVTTRRSRLSIWPMHFGIGKSRTCFVAHAVYCKRDTARHDERSKRDTSVTTSATGAIRNLYSLFVLYLVLYLMWPQL